MVAHGSTLDLMNEAAQFEREGYYIARGLLRPDEVALIRDTFMDANKDGPVEGLSDFRKDGQRDGVNGAYEPSDPLAFYPRMMFPHLHANQPVGPVAMRFMLDGRLHLLLRALMGDEPVAVQTMFYFKPPGARGQDLHQDNFYLRVKPGTCCAAWIAIDDADHENGGMMVVPGTQHMEIACPERADPTKYFTTEHVEPPPGLSPVMLKLKAGDVLFFNGNIIHGSYPNTSKTRFRRSLICHYVPEQTTELATWYKHPIKFDGTRLGDYPPAQGGGPCGTVQEAGAPH